MSSILKALKKAENEKSPARGNVAPLTRDLLSEDTAPLPLRREPRGRLWMVIAVGMLAGAAAGGYLIIGSGGPAPVTPVAETAVRNESPPEPAVIEVALTEQAPAVISPVETPAVAAAASPTAPAAKAAESAKVAEEVAKVTSSLKDTAQTLKKTASALKNKVIVATDRGKLVSPSAARTDLRSGVSPSPTPKYASYGAASSTLAAGDGIKKTAERRTTVPVAVASRTPGWNLGQLNPGPVPELIISEIHYRPSVKDRLAVVNDLPVMEGVDIEGARVDRIFKDRIRFVINGQYKEVLLKKSR